MIAGLILKNSNLEKDQEIYKELNTCTHDEWQRLAFPHIEEFFERIS